MDNKDIQDKIKELLNKAFDDDELFLFVYKKMIECLTERGCYQFEGKSDYTVEDENGKKEKFHADVKVDITSEKC